MSEGPLENALYLCEKVEDVRTELEIKFPIFSTLCFWKRGGPAAEAGISKEEYRKFDDLYNKLVQHVVGDTPESAVIAHRGIRVINRFVRIPDQEPLWEAYLRQLKLAKGKSLEHQGTLFPYKGPRREVICIEPQTIARPRFTALLAEDHPEGLVAFGGKMEDLEEIMQVVPEKIAYDYHTIQGMVPILNRLEDLRTAGLLHSSPEDFRETIRTRPLIAKGKPK